MKITLFFCAGIMAKTRGIHDIDQMDGIGRSMPLTMGMFTIASLGMIGVPPVAGFVSKWYLAAGGIQAGEHWVVALLVLSSVLNAGYFLPILHAAWFKTAPETETAGVLDSARRDRKMEAPWSLLVPTLVTAFFCLAAGVFAAWAWSPLGVAEQIVFGRGGGP
jgi:multicomponent Na+:H+ antiporter subunit D